MRTEERASAGKRFDRRLNVLERLGVWLIPPRFFDWLFHFSPVSASSTVRSLSRINPDFFTALSENKVLRLYRTASKWVPAYRDFLKAHNIRPADIKTIFDFERDIPSTNKDNYVRRYPLEARCRQGCFPIGGWVEESSGSSGHPTNWVRSFQEDKPYTSLMKTIMAYLYPVEKGQKFIILNGFALGAWAGGLTFSRRAGPSGLIKNIGPDAMKIIQSMRDLGTEGIYLISGYPPFLRRLIDAGKNTQGFDWKNYCVHLFSGGEGFSEEWRDHMVSQLKDGARIFSTYGAIDLEAGIAMENPLCVAIRRLLNRDHELRHELLATNRFPCFLGMYSPLNFYISTAESPGGLKELETTVLSLRSASPKIKYNIGDEGGVIPFRRMEDSLNRRGYDLFKLGGESSLPSVVPFPFLFLLGRSDGTVSIEGSNIYASDIHDAISSDPELASKVSTFKLAVETESDASPRLYVYVEAREDVELSESWTKRCSAVVVSKILAVNECFRKSCEENPEAAAPRIVCLPFRRGVFAEEEKLIKHRYIKK